jgi:hypothetical protein
MLRLNIINKIYCNEPTNIIISIANSTIYDNINNICTHIAYNINKYKMINNVIKIKLIFDYPKYKTVICDINNMYNEMSKIMKPVKKQKKICENFIKYISTELDEINIKTVLIFIEGLNSIYYNNYVPTEFIEIKKKMTNINMTLIRTNSDCHLFNMNNIFDKYIFKDNILLNITKMNIPINELIKINFKNNYFIGSFNELLEYYLINSLYLIPYDTNLKEYIYHKYIESDDINYTITITTDDITIYELCDNINIFYNTIKFSENDTIKNNYEKCILSYNYFNTKIRELHNKARLSSNNDEYRCASFGQYYLNLINDEIIKLNIIKIKNNEIVEGLFECYNIENTFSNKHIKKIYLSTIKKNINIIGDIKNEINKIKNNYNEEINEQIVESCDFYTSNISLTNWLEEINNGSSLGLLYKVNTTDLGKIGFLSNIQIINTTMTFLSTKDYLECIISKMKIMNLNGNLNNVNIFTDNIIGESNAIIPIYINKYHWDIASIYIKPLLSIAIAHHPCGWEKTFYNIYFMILVNMTSKFHLINNLNEKWIIIYFAIIRTCQEIIKENKYNTLNLIKKYINDISLMTHNKFDITVLLGQILCADINIDILNEIIEKMLHSFFLTKKLKSFGYDLKYIKYLQKMNTIEEIKNDLDKCFEQININFNEELQNIIYVYQIKKILINNNINMEQMENGKVTNDIIILLKDNIIEKIISIAEIYQMIDIKLNWKAILLKYLLNLDNKSNNYSLNNLFELDYNDEINKYILYNI